MTVHVHFLASGSSGNACLVEADGGGLLLDFGVSPRLFAQRLKSLNASWKSVRAAVLSHTHTDHWHPTMLSHLRERGIPLYCHADHARVLGRDNRAFDALEKAGLLRCYEIDETTPVEGFGTFRAIAIAHDSETTCGFRVEGPANIFGSDWAVGYAADLGSWTPELAQLLVDVDVLAVEFNHDVLLQVNSGRSPHLIRRVLGDRGHLSNKQGAELFAEVLRLSEPGRVQHLVQLHLSRQCNRADLARSAAEAMLASTGQAVEIHTTSQEAAGPSLAIGLKSKRPPRRARAPGDARERVVQPLLPGWE